MTTISLKLRILLLLSASSLFVLAVLALSILWIFERSVERSLDAHLAAYTDILVNELAIEDGALKWKQTSNLLNNIPRHWQVASRGHVLFKSAGFDGEFPLMPEVPGEIYRVNCQVSDGTKLLGVQNSFVFAQGLTAAITFGLEEEIAKRYVEQEKQALRRPLFELLALVFLLFCVAALLAAFLVVRPLLKLQAAICAVRTGQAARIEGVFPEELGVVADEINRVLAALSHALGRLRTFAADLSHALRTPLTVIKNEASTALIKEKAEIMEQLIERNLARVSAAGAGRVIGVRTAVKPVAERILKGFSKIYPVETELIIDGDVCFYGDEADLFELLGNIIENACKFASSSVRVFADQSAIIVEDDGPGVPPEKFNLVLERGVRLDSAVSGSGIGLAVSGDIAALYSGSIELGLSRLSGLKVTIRLPLGR